MRSNIQLITINWLVFNNYEQLPSNPSNHADSQIVEDSTIHIAVSAITSRGCFSPIAGPQMDHPDALSTDERLGRVIDMVGHQLMISAEPYRLPGFARKDANPYPLTFLRKQLKCCLRFSGLIPTLKSTNVGRFHLPAGQGRNPLPDQPTLVDFTLPRVQGRNPLPDQPTLVDFTLPRGQGRNPLPDQPTLVDLVGPAISGDGTGIADVCDEEFRMMV